MRLENDLGLVVPVDDRALVKNDQADRAISTGKLHASQRFHTRPINVVVYHGSSSETLFRGGFPA